MRITVVLPESLRAWLAESGASVSAAAVAAIAAQHALVTQGARDRERRRVPGNPRHPQPAAEASTGKCAPYCHDGRAIGGVCMDCGKPHHPRPR